MRRLPEIAFQNVKFILCKQWIKGTSATAGLWPMDDKPKRIEIQVLARKICKAMFVARGTKDKATELEVERFSWNTFVYPFQIKQRFENHILTFCYNEVIEQILEKLDHLFSYLWTKLQGRYISILIVGQRQSNWPIVIGSHNLLEQGGLICLFRVVNKTSRFLWSNLDVRLLKLFLTDSEAHMLKEGRYLKISNLNMPY